MAFDSARNVTVLFGGWQDGPVADTWEYNSNCNSWISIQTDHSPTPRVGFAITYDSVRQTIVLFGGMNPVTGEYFNDTWEYNGNDWLHVITASSPPQMSAKTMAFDSSRNRTVLIGGEESGTSYNDTWEYDGTNWIQVSTPVSPPAPGSLAALSYDAARSQSVLTFHDGTESMATWEYDGANWSAVNVAEAPLGRWAHTTVYDSYQQRLLLFGGVSPYSPTGLPMNDTWEYDGHSWTQISTTQTPPPADQHTMSFDTNHGQAIVLNWGETWAFRRNEISPECEFSVFRVHPREVFLRDGKTTEQLRIEIRDSELRPRDPGKYAIEFASSDPALVQVSSDGLVTSTGYGQALITATLVEANLQAPVDVFAGHLRTAPALQYLSLNGQSTGQVTADMGNADGTPVDLAGHGVEYHCAGCEPGQPFRVDENGVIQMVELFEEGDPDPPGVLVVVDGDEAENFGFVHPSEFDLELTVNEYVTHNIALTSAAEAQGYDFDEVIRTLRVPEILELGYQAQKELTGGIWRHAGRQAIAHLVGDGIGACGGSGSPIQIGTYVFDPLITCFVTAAEPGEMVHGYGIAFHEMGHNFTYAHGRFWDFAAVPGNHFNYSEGLATAAGMFACESILRASEGLALSPEIVRTIENSWLCWRSWNSGDWLADYVASGSDYAYFDPNIVDDIFYTLIQEFGWSVLYRFYSSLLPHELGDFPFPIETTAQQATFFALAVSEAARTDLKSRFRDVWGFPIDEDAWEMMEPLIKQLVPQRDPASYAGPDRSALIDEVITLEDAYVFDWEGDPLNVTWQVIDQPPGAGVVLGDDQTLHTTFSANRHGIYTLGLTAVDQWVHGPTDTLQITVTDPNIIFSDGFE